MSWLRIDDGFSRHPKIEQLTDREFRTWIGLLCYCAEYRNSGVIYKQSIGRSVRGATPAFLERCVEVGLLDPTSGSNGLQKDVHFQVHDFDEYNGSKDTQAAERMRRYRKDHPRVSGGKWERTREAVYERDGGVCVDCGSTTEDWNADHEPDRAELERLGIGIYDIAYIFTRCHSCHAKKTRRQAANTEPPTEPLSEPTTEPNSEPRDNGSDPSHAGTRARPVPSPSSLSPSAVASYQPDGRKDEIEAHRIEPLAQLAAAHADDDIPL